MVPRGKVRYQTVLQKGLDPHHPPDDSVFKVLVLQLALAGAAYPGRDHVSDLGNGVPESAVLLAEALPAMPAMVPVAGHPEGLVAFLATVPFAERRRTKARRKGVLSVLVTLGRL
jgi:hypothetical protein